ncbi:hypothetical protein MKX03_017974 [Papaver bracteatum]|nr:hypothetical protein MKX03_017974 [Papaver bracteatum]
MSLQLEIPNGEAEKDPKPSEPTEGPPKIERNGSYKRTLSGGLQSPKADSPKKKILEDQFQKGKIFISARSSTLIKTVHWSWSKNRV